MNEYILILLNERSRTDFLDNLQSLIGKSLPNPLLLYFTPKNHEIEVALPIQFKQYPSNYAGEIPVINQEQSIDHLKITFLLNLSGHEILDTRLKNIPEITSQFFDQLYMNYCPAIINSIIQQKDSCEFQVVVREKNGQLFELTTGTFKILPYDYQKSIQLSLTGNIHLIVAGLLRFSRNQPGKLISNPRSIEPFSIHQFHLFRRRHNQARFKHRFNKLFFHDKWNVGIIASPIEEVALSENKKWEVKWLQENDALDFSADPFGCEINDHKILFIEKFISQKGIIQSQENSAPPQKALELPFHLSYPYTLLHDQIWYCIPEQSQSHSVKIYQINEENYTLENPSEILSNFSAVDPSLIYKDGKWYLFCTDATDKGADVRLHIFISDELIGPYRPHDKNPVKTDIRSARCAGKIFKKDGQIYRPAQDSSKTYGGEIIIHRIDQLTEKEFTETEINRLLPANFNGIYKKGCHTLSALGSSTLIDGKRNMFSFRNLFQIFRKK